MPIYEYECRGCEHRFEKLIRPSSDGRGEIVVCPACQSADLPRLLSPFAVSSEGTQQLHLQHGRKLGEKERRDKQRADVEATLNHDH